MLGVLKKKLNKQEKEDSWQAEDDHNGDDDNDQEMGYDDGKLTLGDLFTSIEKSKEKQSGNSEVVNTNRL